jgi:hypothetical protein
MAELKRWVERLLLPRHCSIEQVMHWSMWRRTHQAVALYHHYRKHENVP